MAGKAWHSTAAAQQGPVPPPLFLSHRHTTSHKHSTAQRSTACLHHEVWQVLLYRLPGSSVNQLDSNGSITLGLPQQKPQRAQAESGREVRHKGASNEECG
jgi:hypothetical protein